MRAFKVFALLLALLPGLVLAQKKPKKSVIPAVFAHATFVYVEAVDGGPFKPGLYTGDRVAIADVVDAIRAWGRYTFVTDRNKADLVFVVRKGQLASGEIGGGIQAGLNPRTGQTPGRQQRPIGAEVDGGLEAGPPDDLLKVCTLDSDGKLSAALWIHSLPNGLDAPRLLLFRQFKSDVESAYPSAAGGQPSKP